MNEILKRKELIFSLREFILETWTIYEKKIFKIKSHINDLLTEADILIEKKLREEINNNFPEDSIIGEENDEKKGNSGYAWYIDPIDGTHPYTRGIKEYGTSIGICLNDKIVFGAILNSEDEKFYWAEIGKGAFCENERIYVKNRSLQQSSILLQVPWKKEKIDTFANLIKILEKKVGPIYSRYAAIQYFLLLATGKVDAIFINGFGGPWDSCAGVILIKEAGAMISKDLEELKKEGFLFASSPEIYKELGSKIKDLIN